MNILAVLIPVTLALGLVGLAAFFWALRADQFDDPDGAAHRILSDRYDDAPKPDDAEDPPGRGPDPAQPSRRNPLDAPSGRP